MKKSNKLGAGSTGAYKGSAKKIADSEKGTKNTVDKGPPKKLGRKTK